GVMILVTGATGRVGRAVVSRLALLGHDVVAMVRDVQAASRRLPSGIALRVSDYEDASALKRALPGVDDMVLISSGANETYGPHLLFTVTPAKAGPRASGAVSVAPLFMPGAGSGCPLSRA